MDNKQYAVLGLGIFGSTVATTLANHGYEVIVIDKDPICVQRIADEVTKAIVGDVTDIEELQAAGIGDSDVAIVAIGTHLEEAVLATMNLKELGIPYVIAKAKNKQFMKILEKVGANRVIRAEKEMGIKVKVAKAMTSSNGKSLIANQDRGFVKIVYDEENDRIIGAQLMCARATDMINEFSTAIVNKLSKKQMQAVIRPHPTFGEMVTEAVDELDSMAIHIAHRK